MVVILKTYLPIPEKEVCWEEQEQEQGWGALGQHPVAIKYFL